MLAARPALALRTCLHRPALCARPRTRHVQLARPPPDVRSFATTGPRFAAPAVSAETDHYGVLGVPKEATRKQIKDKFYELSRKYHPDAPSTSSDTPEQRTARFQQLSQSYSVLSDPSSRRSYDLARTGSSVPPHRRKGHPGYTSASGGMGYSGADAAGRSDGAWTENDERRQRANYAWQHPSRAGFKSAGEAAGAHAHARHDPFASRRARATQSAPDHFATYAARASARHAAQAGTGGAGAGAAGSHYRAGTAVFGADKADEESRFINDSSTLRSGQVAAVFLAVFFIAYSFSRRKDKEEEVRRR
ncbi:hypothetical protein JCM10449v2_004388 [Rhodotorula kratochvilovae]